MSLFFFALHLPYLLAINDRSSEHTRNACILKYNAIIEQTIENAHKKEGTRPSFLYFDKTCIYSIHSCTDLISFDRDLYHKNPIPATKSNNITDEIRASVFPNTAFSFT